MDLEAKKEAPETPEKHNKVDYILHDTIYTCSVFSIQYNTFNLHLPVLFSMVGNSTTRRWEWEKGKDYIHVDQLDKFAEQIGKSIFGVQVKAVRMLSLLSQGAASA